MCVQKWKGSFWSPVEIGELSKIIRRKVSHVLRRILRRRFGWLFSLRPSVSCVAFPARLNFIKIILSREYLITLHKSRTPLYGSLSGSQVAELTRTGALLLALFENSTAKLIRSFCSARNVAVLPVQRGDQPTRNPLWWRLRNFRGALLRDARLLHGILAAGDRFFSPDDRSFFESIRAKIYLLSDVTNRLLLRMDPPADVPFKRVQKKIS
jgi:hypothetical protein